MRNKLQRGRQYLHKTCLIKDFDPRYTKDTKYNNKKTNFGLKMGKSPKQTPHQTRYTDDDNHMPRSSWSDLISKLQFKITMRYHYTPIRMATIQNTNTARGWGAYGWSKGDSYPSLGGKQNGSATLEDGLVISWKTKQTLTIWSSNHDPWYLQKWIENLCPQKPCIPMIIAALFIIAKT